MTADLRSSPVPPLVADDHVRGAAELPLLVLYGEFTCPACALAHHRLRDLPIRVAFRHFALSSRPRALALAAVAEAAARQGAFWQMHDALYEDPAHTDDPYLWRRASALGLDLERLQSDRRSEQVAQRIRRDLQSGLRAGVTTTPTLFLGGIAYPGAPTAELLSTLARPAVR